MPTPPNISNPTSPPSSTSAGLNPSEDWTSDYSGYHETNVIIAGRHNSISNSRRCSIIQGVNNTISSKYNSHIIGDHVTASTDNAFYIGCSNGLFSYGDVVAFAASDQRLKDDIIPISGCLDKINTIDAVEFNWNENQQTYSGHDIGLIAQQIQEIAPEIVTERNNGYLAVKYEKMVPILVGAIQEQQSIINEMRAEIDELKLKTNH
jgi:hypothetical protein